MGCTISTDVQRGDLEYLDDSIEELPRNFDPQVISKSLHDAIEERQEEYIIKLFYKYTDDDYQKLSRVFPNKYSIDIITFASQYLSCNASEFVRLRLESPVLSVCNYLHHQLHERPNNYNEKVIGVMCGYQEMNFVQVATEYRRLYHVPLVEHLKSCFSGDLLDVLHRICLPKHSDPDHSKCDECVTRLHESVMTSNLIDGDQEFFRQMKTYSVPFMKTVLESYIQKYQRDLVVEIEKCCPPSETRNHYALMANVVRHSQLYFARLINDILKYSNDDPDMKYYYLMFYTMTRSPDALRQLKEAYRTFCFESLSEEIRGLVTDPIANALLLKTVLRVPSN